MSYKYDVFISYSRKDYQQSQNDNRKDSIVRQIMDQLHNEGFSFWIDEEGIYSGDQFAEVIVENIIDSKVFLFISTKQSNESMWTCKEIATANKFNKPIIPFCYDTVDFSSKFLLYLVDQDRISYVENPSTAFARLTRAVKRKIEKVDQENLPQESTPPPSNQAFEYDFSDLLSQEHDPLWVPFIDNVVSGNVVPVIGPHYLVNGNDQNLHRRVIRLLAQESGMPDDVDTFSELIDHPFFISKFRNVKNIYPIVHRIFENNPKLETTDVIKQILGSRHFPFVLSTSFTKVVENYLLKVWANSNVDIYNFDNSVQGTTRPTYDVPEGFNFKSPGLYYIFGRECERYSRFAITEEDLMDFCMSWLNNSTHPVHLIEALKDKTLLFIGCDYPDWLFRLIIKMLKPYSKDLSDICVVTERTTPRSFVQYLKRNNCLSIEGISAFVETFNNRINNMAWDMSIPQTDSDVYISYSRRNLPFVEKLAKCLTDKGLKVWYDLAKLSGSHHLEMIHKAISTTKVFVPILSSEVTRTTTSFHTYRYEWKVSINLRKEKSCPEIFPIWYSKTKQGKMAGSGIPQLFIDNAEGTYTEEFDSIGHLCDVIINKMKPSIE